MSLAVEKEEEEDNDAGVVALI